MAALPSNLEEARERLFKMVSFVPIAGCWLWTGCVNNRGYGQTNAGKGNAWLAHRLMWALHGGDLPPRMELLHSCDVPSCVNPGHLSLGTHKDNMVDMSRKGRHRTPNLSGERHPAAKLSAEQVAEIRASQESSSAAGARFGVSSAHIRLIRKGGVWQ